MYDDETPKRGLETVSLHICMYNLSCVILSKALSFRPLGVQESHSLRNEAARWSGGTTAG